MRRVISLYLPNWPIDRLYRMSPGALPAPDQPLILVGKEGRRRAVAALNDAAHALGVRKDMPATKAQALVPGLILRDADLAEDVAALERLALWALRYAPIVAADAPDGLVIDSTGADHLHGGEEAMLNGMIMRFAASGITARAAIAGSWDAAHALARFRAQPVFVAASGEEAALLRPLPLVALRLSTDHIEGLHTLGFERIGDLIETPRAPLTLRFGPEIGRRLDQALGAISVPFDPVRSPDLIEVRSVFGEPIGAAETIARYISKLVQELVTSLEASGLGVRRLDLLCHRVDNRVEVLRVGTAQPVRDAKRLTRLLCDRVKKIDPGFGIELMVLAATIAEPFDVRQAISCLVEDPEADCADLIDLLANRIGERRLYRFAPVQSDVPERSVRRIPANAPDDGESWSLSWPRPPRLLATPEPIETVALLPDHPPVTFTWHGQRRHVKRADGPERVFGEWWERDAELTAVRDYFQVEDESGERFWIYRAGDGEDPATGSHRWFIHGIFA